MQDYSSKIVWRNQHARARFLTNNRVMWYYFAAMIFDVLLAGLVVISGYTDVRYRRVYNFVTFPAMMLGVGLHFIYFGFAGGGDALSGAGAGFIFFLPFYLLGGMGAGDVKFMMAAGALKGFSFIVSAGLYGAICGGVAAVAVLIYRKRLLKTLRQVFVGCYLLLTFHTRESVKFDPRDSIRLPYTVFLSCGIIIKIIFG